MNLVELSGTAPRASLKPSSVHGDHRRDDEGSGSEGHERQGEQPDAIALSRATEEPKSRVPSEERRRNRRQDCERAEQYSHAVDSHPTAVPPAEGERQRHGPQQRADRDRTQKVGQLKAWRGRLKSNRPGKTDSKRRNRAADCHSRQRGRANG